MRSVTRTRGAAAAFVLLASLSLAAPALAQANYVGATPPQVGNTDTGASSRGVSVLGAGGFQGASGSGVGAAGGSAAGGSRNLLAFTGGDLMMLLFLAGALVGTGVIIVHRSRSAVN